MVARRRDGEEHEVHPVHRDVGCTLEGRLLGRGPQRQGRPSASDPTEERRIRLEEVGRMTDDRTLRGVVEPPAPDKKRLTAGYQPVARDARATTPPKPPTETPASAPKKAE